MMGIVSELIEKYKSISNKEDKIVEENKSEQEILEIFIDENENENEIYKDLKHNEINKIFLSSVYFHDDLWVRENRYKNIIKAFKTIITNRNEIIIFCPIIEKNAILTKLCDDIKISEYFKKMNNELIGLCDEFWIFEQEGWDKNIQLLEEIEFAKKLTKKIINFKLNQMTNEIIFC